MNIEIINVLQQKKMQDTANVLYTNVKVLPCALCKDENRNLNMAAKEETMSQVVPNIDILSCSKIN